MARPGASLNRWLALAFAAVAALTVGLVVVILVYTWQLQFDRYVREGLQETSDGAAEILAFSYDRSGGWTVNALAQMPRFGVMSGLGLQLLDPQGDIIYDDVAFGVLSGVGVPSGYREPTGQIVTSPVIVGGEVVGIVRVWPLSPTGLLSENDLQFQKSSTFALAGAALIAVVFASLAGMWFARALVRPIDRITATAEALRTGDDGARTGMEGEDAISVLGRTLDEMADAIQADREMERRLTADVAHELRTPLQAIQATVEAMQDGVLPADEERLGVVRDETVRLARLADGILELTRLERGSVPMDMRVLDVGDPVRTAIDAHRALLESVELVLHADIADHVRVRGDSDRLTQAVGNLISNAARYTPAGGSVFVALRAEDDRAVIEVADTGVGISQNDEGKVFDRFWRADAARHSATGGLGIGLAIVKEIVERHGGAVGTARREGGGSVFTIRLPLAR